MVSKSTKQILLSNIAHQISELHREQTSMKKLCAYWYTVADKSNPHAFEMLNISREFLRNVNREIKKLSQCSRELKLDLVSVKPRVAKMPRSFDAMQAISRQHRTNKSPPRIFNIVDVTNKLTIFKTDDGWKRDESVDRSEWNRGDWEREDKLLFEKRMEAQYEVLREQREEMK